MIADSPGTVGSFVIAVAPIPHEVYGKPAAMKKTATVIVVLMACMHQLPVRGEPARAVDYYLQADARLPQELMNLRRTDAISARELQMILVEADELLRRNSQLRFHPLVTLAVLGGGAVAAFACYGLADILIRSSAKKRANLQYQKIMHNLRTSGNDPMPGYPSSANVPGPFGSRRPMAKELRKALSGDPAFQKCFRTMRIGRTISGYLSPALGTLGGLAASLGLGYFAKWLVERRMLHIHLVQDSADGLERTVSVRLI